MSLEVQDGELTVGEDLAGELISHGFSLKVAAPVVAQHRVELVQLIMAPLRTVVEGMPDADLRNLVGLSDEDRNTFWGQFRSAISSYPQSIADKKTKTVVESADLSSATKADAPPVDPAPADPAPADPAPVAPVVKKTAAPKE
jgi:hypothetical protein